MDLKELIQNNPGINITVTGKDLLEYGQFIAKQTAEAVLESHDEKLLTAAEVEALFSIVPATRWRWDKIGLLKARRVGARIYYPESEVRELLNKRSK